MPREREIQRKIEYFINPRRVFSARNVSANPAIVPSTRGIYGWYFDILPPRTPKGNVTVDGHMLLYIGIAGATPGSKSTLRKRIRSNHLGKHSTPQSTLRRTLGKRLTEQLRLVRQAKAGKKYWYGPEGEARLRQWMIDHTILAWQEDDIPREIEAAILSASDILLPLNKAR